TPLVNAVVLSGFALAHAGDARAHEEHLLPLLRGDRRYATCLTGPSGFAPPGGVAVRATRSGDGWRLTGSACFVPYAASADVFLVLATSERGHTLLAVDAATRGLHLRALPTLGGDRQGRIRFADVALPRSAVIGAPETAWDTLRPALDRALVVQCADLLGAAEAAMRYAVAWVTTREQWGVPLGTFQAVQHRCADMFTDVTLCRDAVAEAAQLYGTGAESATTASALKAFCAPRCRRVSASAHQLGGGEGIHADVPLHLWYRRIKAAEPALGGPRHHRARVAEALLGRTPR
ncbi:MAG: acyl-CoA dehydrogenase, partial [Streptomycetaceae bacterium]|nr:acyl-CoA dehydrogenase [Streptomycetaceae bacterium]